MLIDSHTEWASPLCTSEVFPSVCQDEFLAFLLEARDRFNIPQLAELLKRVYFPLTE